MTMILEKILKYKKEELEHFKRKCSLEELRSQAADRAEPHSLLAGLKNTPAQFAVIAEVKQKSPSKGLLRQDFDPLAIAKTYRDHGASALSVLTDEHFFGGSLDHLRKIRQEIGLPLLRKDFIWDPYQVYAAREAGADAILLIAAMLETSQAEDLKGLAEDLGLSVLLEVHEEAECVMAQRIHADLVGVNNRDLKTFEVSLATSERLFPKLPDGSFRISESGIHSRDDLERLQQAGANGFLIGEFLIKQKDPGEALEKLLTEKGSGP